MHRFLRRLAERGDGGRRCARGIPAKMNTALITGGSLIVILDRMIKNILNSPVLIRNLEVLAASWPAPVRESISDLGKLATEITDGKPTTFTATTGGTTIITNPPQDTLPPTPVVQ